MADGAMLVRLRRMQIQLAAARLGALLAEQARQEEALRQLEVRCWEVEASRRRMQGTVAAGGRIDVLRLADLQVNRAAARRREIEQSLCGLRGQQLRLIEERRQAMRELASLQGGLRRLETRSRERARRAGARRQDGLEEDARLAGLRSPCPESGHPGRFF